MTARADDTAELVQRAREGDAEALSALARRHLRAAYVVALGVTRRPEVAEDVAQEAFVVAMERLDDCREPARFAGWLVSIVRSRALNALAHRRVREQASLPEPEAEVAPDALRLGLRRRLLEALGELPAVQREVVLLHDLEGWTHAEIAGAIGSSEVMSRQHLFQARRRLRELLAGEEEALHGS